MQCSASNKTLLHPFNNSSVFLVVICNSGPIRYFYFEIFVVCVLSRLDMTDNTP